jgi:hypothetical protein
LIPQRTPEIFRLTESPGRAYNRKALQKNDLEVKIDENDLSAEETAAFQGARLPQTHANGIRP